MPSWADFMKEMENDPTTVTAPPAKAPVKKTPAKGN